MVDEDFQLLIVAHTSSVKSWLVPMLAKGEQHRAAPCARAPANRVQTRRPFACDLAKGSASIYSMWG